MSASTGAPAVTDPFEKTLCEFNALRLVLANRLGWLLGCDQRSRTVECLNELMQAVTNMKAYIAVRTLDKAIQSLKHISASGFSDASRVLKGADEDIPSRGKFIVEASQRLEALKSTFARELAGYQDRFGPHSIPPDPNLMAKGTE